MQSLKWQISSETRREIEAALTHDHPPWVHRRILAVYEVLKGASVSKAAKRAKACPSSVERWVDEARKSGVAKLLRNRFVERRRKKLRGVDLGSVQAELAAALKHRPDWRLAKRLTAIEAILAGKTSKAAARAAGVSLGTIARWVRALESEGVGGILSDHERGARKSPMDGNSAALRALAANATNCRTVKRLLVVAEVIEEKSAVAVAARWRISEQSIERWMRRYRAGGIDALRDKETPKTLNVRAVRMNRIRSKRLGVTLEEVRTYLAGEHRARIRKRLRAMQMVLKGATIGRAAKAANVSKMTVEAWVRIVRAWGCSGLLSVDKPLSAQARLDKAAVREHIREALDGKISLRVRKRLIAIDRLLTGEKVDHVAQDMRIQSGTLQRWIADVRKTNMSEMFGGPV
jgi:transposase